MSVMRTDSILKSWGSKAHRALLDRFGDFSRSMDREVPEVQPTLEVVECPARIGATAMMTGVGNVTFVSTLAHAWKADKRPITAASFGSTERRHVLGPEGGLL